jgi:hypothetical protein
MMKEVSWNELAAHTELRGIVAILRFGAHVDNSLALSVDRHPTPYAAEAAVRVRRAIRLSHPFAHFFTDGAGGANIDAGAAEFTARLLLCLVEGGAHQGRVAAVDKGKHFAVAFLVADAYTSAAEDAEIVVQLVEGIVFDVGNVPVDDGKPDLGKLEVIDQLLQFAGANR